MRIKSLVLLLFFSLSACTLVGPNYKRPPAIVSQNFKEAQGQSFIIDKIEWQAASPKDCMERGKWWKTFQDPLLNRLEEELIHHNQSIVQAVATYFQSKAIVDEARSNYFPTLVGSFDLFRQRFGGGSTAFTATNGGVTSTGIANTAVLNQPLIATTISGLLNANWEPDLWGQVQRTVEANAAAAQANQALVEATKLSAAGSLAQYYFELRTLDSDQILLDKTVKTYAQILRITRNQYRAGTVSQANILQAQSALETSKAQAINNGILRSQYEHAIAVLLGRPPASFHLGRLPLNAKVPSIPVSLPSILLERRPDIAQAERLVKQANAQIGVAIAAYYPILNLTASISAAGNTFSQLFNQPSIGWNYGLELGQLIFDGGLRAASLSAAKHGYTAQVAAYRQTVLTAFQNVEDNLVNLRLLQKQEEADRLASQLAQKALVLSINQYRAGTVDYISVLNAEVTAYTAEKTLNDLQGLEMTGAVGLIKALGGGFSSHMIKPIDPSFIASIPSIRY